MKLCVIGCGYVGLVQAACLAAVGHSVDCYDVDQKRVVSLNLGVVPIHEPGLQDLVVAQIGTGRLRFVGSLVEALAGATVAFVCVGTPPLDDGSADLSNVLAAVRDVAACASGPLILVTKSTVPVGTGDRVQGIVAECPHPVAVVSNPEFLAEGRALEDFRRPERVVIGIASSLHQYAADVLADLYRPFMRGGAPILVMRRRSAELAKYACNAMLAARVSFVNEIARVCDAVGADIAEVREGLASDSRIGSKFLHAGPSFGGSCFSKDLSALASLAAGLGVSNEMSMATLESNAAHRSWLVHQLERGATFPAVGWKGVRIAFWGLAFKAHTDDVRDAVALWMANMLDGTGASIVAHDPQAWSTFAAALGPAHHVTYADTPMDAVRGADALVLLTEWPEYAAPDWSAVKAAMRGMFVLDGRNLWRSEDVAAAGLRYQGVGAL